jgi:hypothetical protein
VACDLLTIGLVTAATIDVAGLGCSIPLREAEPLIREMLDEHDVPVPGPDAGQAVKFQVVLRAFGTAALDVGEFAAVLHATVPAWDHQSETEQVLVGLLDDWERESTAVGQAEIAAAVRRVALSTVGE